MSPVADPFVVEDLKGANRKDADRLSKAEVELAKREAALRAASDQRDAAMKSVIAAGVEGKDDSRAAQNLASAKASVQKARELRDLRAEVVETVRAQVLAAVRAERSVEPMQRLSSIQQQYDELLDLFKASAGLLDRMVALREAERQAAADLATARRDGGMSAFGFEASTGSRYATVPDIQVGFWVVRDRVRMDVESPAHLSATLRRRNP